MARNGSRDPKIDEEFMFLLPPHTPEEKEALRQNIIDHGILDPLKVWLETGILLDGYNRFEYAKEFNLRPKVETISLPNREAAREWILRNQAARRNMTKEKLAYIRGKLYNEKKLPLGENLLSNCQSDNSVGSTAETLANEFNVSTSTIIRDGQFAAGVDAAEDKPEILAGTSGKTMSEVRKAAPVFCRSCRITTPKKDCKECAGLRGGKPKKPSKRKKAGVMKFDWAMFKRDILGRFVRSIDAIYNGYDRKGSAGHKRTIELLGQFVDHLKVEEKDLCKGA